MLQGSSQGDRFYESRMNESGFDDDAERDKTLSQRLRAAVGQLSKDPIPVELLR